MFCKTAVINNLCGNPRWNIVKFHSNISPRSQCRRPGLENAVVYTFFNTLYTSLLLRIITGTIYRSFRYEISFLTYINIAINYLHNFFVLLPYINFHDSSIKPLLKKIVICFRRNNPNLYFLSATLVRICFFNFLRLYHFEQTFIFLYFALSQVIGKGVSTNG